MRVQFPPLPIIDMTTKELIAEMRRLLGDKMKYKLVGGKFDGMEGELENLSPTLHIPYCKTMADGFAGRFLTKVYYRAFIGQDKVHYYSPDTKGIPYLKKE